MLLGREFAEQFLGAGGERPWNLDLHVHVQVSDAPAADLR
jgi:hypothetical protein